MSWLSAQSMALLVLLFVGGLTGVAWLGRALGRRIFRGSHASAASVATPLMPALGTAFAVLAAFTVATAASSLRDAELDVGREANAAARLAWASNAAPDGGAPMRADLLRYLDATLAGEWRDIDRTSPGAGPAFDELDGLERAVRAAAAGGGIGAPQTSELLGAVDDLSGARRSRFAEASPIAGGLVALLVLSAVTLILNATIVTLERERRAAAVLGGLVLVTGLSIASVLTLGSPFAGSFGASPRPLADVASDLRSGRFQIVGGQ